MENKLSNELDLTICLTNMNNVTNSFDRIAKKLINDFILIVNDSKFRFTEIEFYYHHNGKHEDNITHEHKRKQGMWRAHNQGFDITFEGNEISCGGILIRGLKQESNNKYTNGPRRCIFQIFEKFNNINGSKNIIEIKYKPKKKPKTIFKTIRQLSDKQKKKKYANKYYRYYTEIEEWQSKHITNNQRKEMETKRKKI